jgi:creatinine amidohydrolase
VKNLTPSLPTIKVFHKIRENMLYEGKNMLLEEMTMRQVEEGLNKTRTVVLPAGSVEEHGPHLPLSTDQLTAYELCREAARSTPLFVAPPLFYGVCRSTSDHPGTVSISTASLKHLVQDIAASLHKHGLRNFILLSGHAGANHMAALTEVGEWILEHLAETKVAVLSILNLMSREFLEAVETPNDSHAGEVETSLVMHLKPLWVRGQANKEFPAFPNPILVRNKRNCWPGGVWGDPTKACAEKGGVFFSLLVQEFLLLIRRIEDFRE